MKVPRMACGVYKNISKQTVLTMTTPSILDNVAKTSWSIVSFDPDSRIVCIDLRNNSNILHLSFTLPIL